MAEGEKVYIELKEPISNYEKAIYEAEKTGEQEDLFDGKIVRYVDEAYMQTSI